MPGSVPLRLAGAIAAAVLVGWYLVSNTLANLDAAYAKKASAGKPPRI